MSGPGGAGFRRDIDGLRALAIVVVVAFHGALTGFDGGFVGVDVFFVISGYLIQTNLFRELDTSGGIRYGAFWARRVRRLAPAMALVILTTLVLAAVILSPLEWSEVARDGLAATGYVSNIRYGLQTHDYFHPGPTNSYFLHTWSLGVEEQFYIVWPLLLGLVAWWASRRGASQRRHRVVVLGVISAVSFAACVVLTQRGTPWAFFSLPTRLWEFGVAGLLVAAPQPAFLERRLPQLVVELGGLAAIVGSTVLFDGSTRYPGYASAVPVAGALALLAVGRSAVPGPVSRALSWRPLGWIGRHSYSWYLWHWPLILFAVVEWGDSMAVKSLASFGALLPAIVTFRFVEQPVRFHPRLVQRAGVTFAVGAILALVCAAGAIGLDRRAGHDVATSPLLIRLQAAAREHVTLGDYRCPAPLEVGDDSACAFGDVTSDRTVMLIGDSHALHWIPPLDEVGRSRHLRIVMRALGGCPAVDVHVANDAPADMSPKTACYRYRRGTQRVLAALRPEAVVLSMSATYEEAILDESDHPTTRRDARASWARANEAFAATVESSGARLGVVVDGPTLTFDPVLCVARAGDFASCNPTRDEVTRADQPFRDIVGRAAEAAGAPTLAATDLLCTADACPLEVDGHIVYADDNHVTGSFARTLTPRFEAFVDAVVR